MAGAVLLSGGIFDQTTTIPIHHSSTGSLFKPAFIDGLASQQTQSSNADQRKQAPSLGLKQVYTKKS
ncbi:hypothetical protein VTI74DRAFT_10816 [Chaetomium olivicolor]